MIIKYQTMIQMKFLRAVNGFCTKASQNYTKMAFKAIVSPQLRSNIANNPNKQKLNILAQAVLSLTNKQIDYLQAIINQKYTQKNPQHLHINNKIFSLDGNSSHPLQFFYQQQWMKAVWKDTHLLTTVVKSQEDQEAGKGSQQAVKQIYDIELTSVDPAQKIKVIKVLRELLSLGLKQAKDFVDKPPIIIKKDKLQQAERLKTQLQKSGCVVTLK